MAKEQGGEVAEGVAAGKTRKPRRGSDYLALRRVDVVADGQDGVHYATVAGAKTLKGLWREVREKKVSGTIVAVCVRKTVKAEVVEQLQFKAV